jgi:hypothetical protein
MDGSRYEVVNTVASNFFLYLDAHSIFRRLDRIAPVFVRCFRTCIADYEGKHDNGDVIILSCTFINTCK